MEVDPFRHLEVACPRPVEGGSHCPGPAGGAGGVEVVSRQRCHQLLRSSGELRLRHPRLALRFREGALVDCLNPLADGRRIITRLGQLELEFSRAVLRRRRRRQVITCAREVELRGVIGGGCDEGEKGCERGEGAARPHDAQLPATSGLQARDSMCN